MANIEVIIRSQGYSGKICTQAKHRKDDNALSDSNEGGPTPGLEGAQSRGGTSTAEELQRPDIIMYCPKFGCWPIASG